MAVPQTAYNTLMGMFRQQQAPAGASVMEQAQADARNQMLGRLGFGLLAAAIPQTAAQRTQSLQQALGGMGDMNTAVYNNAQARLMAQQIEERQAAARRSSELAQRLAGGGAIAAPVAPTSPVAAPVMADDFRAPSPAAQRIIAPPPPTSAAPTVPQYDEFGLLPQQRVQIAGMVNSGLLSGEQAIEEARKLALENTKKASETGGFKGSESLVGVFDEKGNYYQTYVDIKEGIVRPRGAVGNLRFARPDEISSQRAAGTVEGRAGAEAKATAPNAIVSVDSAMNLIDSLLSDKASLANVTGEYQGNISDPSLAYIASGFDPKATGTIAKIEQLQAKAFIAAIPAIKGTGALSDAEGARLDAAEARLKRTQGEADFVLALQEYRDILGRVKQRQSLIASGVSPAQALIQVPESPFAGSNQTPATQSAPSAPAESSIPSGIDPEDWKYMSPEERKLWQ